MSKINDVGRNPPTKKLKQIKYLLLSHVGNKQDLIDEINKIIEN